MSARDLLKESVLKSAANKKQFKFFSTDVFIKDALTSKFDLQTSFRKLEKIIPSYYLFYVDIIYIGNFPNIFNYEAGPVNAVYKDGAIYITNVQDNEEDFIDDLVHEISHAVEKQFADEIYSDQGIEKEFLAKRSYMEKILRHNGYDTNKLDFENVNYNSEFDKFMNLEIGYSTLNSLLNGLFVSPYAATSLREYFAIAFEEYYLNDRRYVNNISPKIYEKINFLDNIGE